MGHGLVHPDDFVRVTQLTDRRDPTNQCTVYSILDADLVSEGSISLLPPTAFSIPRCSVRFYTWDMAPHLYCMLLF